MPFISSSLLPLSVLATLLAMVMQRNQLLMALLTLEAMILAMTLLILTASSFVNLNELFTSMVLLTFGACEASLGLACLVKMARTFGNDQVSSLSTTKC
uniref:NADH-ubiquinone oxidoreductase chain 4L n=1 Tax=Panthalis oerstedi TaxID=318815 RepID=A0A343W6D8_9ANNE|nr:NADH dehydrogenase subunit 4L [Panthalis oerstedi]